MQLLSRQMSDYVNNSSWIRRMFEAGIALQQKYGPGAVCDFSLGNPDLPPPAQVAEGLRDLADEAHKPFSFGYMPNNGFPWALELIAGHVGKEQGVKLNAGDVILTCGAAGAINAFFRSVLDPGDVVHCVAPYFVEYGFYTENHQGVLKPVPSKAGTFELDLAAIEAALGPKSRAFIINSPNNPTGQIYSRKELEALAEILKRKSKENGRPIFLVSDEPYRFLAYDGAEVPAVLPMYEYAVVANSFSKSLSLPGERIGYLALSPLMPEREALMAALVMANRILGFVNPPLVGQHLLKKALGHEVSIAPYARRRDLMAKMLTEAGYDFVMPKGAFYFFPKAPGGDCVAFTNRLAEELVLAVPGVGFGMPGYFRMTFCVNEELFPKAAPALKKVRLELEKK